MIEKVHENCLLHHWKYLISFHVKVCEPCDITDMYFRLHELYCMNLPLSAAIHFPPYRTWTSTSVPRYRPTGHLDSVQAYCSPSSCCCWLLGPSSAGSSTPTSIQTPSLVNGLLRYGLFWTFHWSVLNRIHKLLPSIAIGVLSHCKPCCRMSGLTVVAIHMWPHTKTCFTICSYVMFPISTQSSEERISLIVLCLHPLLEQTFPVIWASPE